jgi:hypothetical protein
VLIVNVEVTADVPEMAAGALAEQVGILLAPEAPALTAQVRATAPVKPPLGVMVMVEVAELPWVTDDIGAALNENALPPPPPAWMTYAAFSIMLVPMVGLIAIASIVSDAMTETGDEYGVDPAVGLVPSVV